MPRRLDLTGQRFGRLVATADAGRGKYGVQWSCICDCGTTRVVPTTALRSGNTKSCGCLASDMTAARNRAARNDSMPYRAHPTEHVIWRTMIARCHNPRSKDYRNYGGRGIRVCPEWRQSFATFFADMGERPAGMQIDRRDNDGPYAPDNCRWATVAVNAQNRRTTCWLTLDGVTLHLRGWAQRTGLSHQVIRHRLNAGWPLRQALTNPKGVLP